MLGARLGMLLGAPAWKHIWGRPPSTCSWWCDAWVGLAPSADRPPLPMGPRSRLLPKLAIPAPPCLFRACGLPRVSGTTCFIA